MKPRRLWRRGCGGCYMTLTVLRSIRALGTPRFVAAASLLALAACADDTPVEATTNLKNLAGEESWDVAATEAQPAAEAQAGVAGEQGEAVGLSGATPAD